MKEGTDGSEGTMSVWRASYIPGTVGNDGDWEEVTGLFVEMVNVAAWGRVGQSKRGSLHRGRERGDFTWWISFFSHGDKTARTGPSLPRYFLFLLSHFFCQCTCSSLATLWWLVCLCFLCCLMLHFFSFV